VQRTGAYDNDPSYLARARELDALRDRGPRPLDRRR
jgi:hypothetical protein